MEDFLLGAATGVMGVMCGYAFCELLRRARRGVTSGKGWFMNHKTGLMGFRQVQVVSGRGNFVNQSGCTVGGSIIGGDLVMGDIAKGEKSSNRCEHCGAPK